MADYYGSAAAADAYHLARGNTAWAGTNDAKLAALLIASEYLDAKWEDQFSGYRTGKIAQSRAWPRSYAYDIWGYAIASDAIPAQVENAVYEIALRQIKSPGSLWKDWTPGTDKRSVAVVGAVSVTYAGAMSYLDAQVQIGGIGSILRPVLSASSAVSSYSGRSSRV